MGAGAARGLARGGNAALALGVPNGGVLKTSVHSFFGSYCEDKFAGMHAMLLVTVDLLQAVSWLFHGGVGAPAPQLRLRPSAATGAQKSAENFPDAVRPDDPLSSNPHHRGNLLALGLGLQGTC